MVQVIGGTLQERLIPVPYSKTSTDQAVSYTLLFTASVLSKQTSWLLHHTTSLLSLLSPLALFAAAAAATRYFSILDAVGLSVTSLLHSAHSNGMSPFFS